MATFRHNSDNSRPSSRLFSPGLFNFDHLERHVQNHLRNVYSCLSIGMLSAAVGAYLHLTTAIGQWYWGTALVSLALMLWLAFTRHSKEEMGKRVAIFVAFTLTSGISLGPLLQMAIKIDPSIISTALAGTAVIFISFTLAALLSRNRTFLYLGGFLFTGLMWLSLTGLFNLFFGSQLIYNVYIYGLLFLFSGFILYDTQLIVEKRRMGDEDFVWHSVDLFLDAVQIFRTLLIILSQKEEDKKRRRV